MPDAQGNFKGAAYPNVPWHIDGMSVATNCHYVHYDSIGYCSKCGWVKEEVTDDNDR
jgi:hypothetical protein